MASNDPSLNSKKIAVLEQELNNEAEEITKTPTIQISLPELRLVAGELGAVL